VNIGALERVARQDPRVAGVEVDVVHPGDSARVVHVVDAVEPRARLEPKGPAFPGVTGPPIMAGQGRTARLAGMAVVLAGLPPGAESPSFWQESVVDMTGPAARVCPLAAIANLVLTVRPDPALASGEGIAAMRLAGFRVAEQLAAEVGDGVPETRERLALSPAPAGCPRVAAVVHLEAWGTLQRTYLYGHGVEGLLPTLLHPNEVLDGALTAASHHLPAIRNSTYFFQNHAVVRELLRRHGAEVDFVGAVVGRAMWAADGDKRRAAAFTAKLLRQLGVAGAVLAFAHGGHAVTDTALTAEACERAGIAVATMMFEMAGEDGTDFGLVQRLPSAEPLVSTGNIDALLSLPPVDRVLGGREVVGVGGHATSRQAGDAALLLPMRHVFAAGNPSGNGRLAGAAG
jgi:glycine reductase complex component B subunit alpha and beta